MDILLPVAYFGNLEYFSNLLKADHIFIEQNEHFVKQTYRNRCEIYGANGKLDLIVPIRHGRKERTIIKNCLIDNSTRWQVLHWRSIESGYRRSPYFEYYEDKISPFFETKFESLTELNEASLNLIFSLLKTEKKYQFTEEYQKEYSNILDLRNFSDPKNREDFQSVKYTQVFENRYGFISNLSILDSLFNLGPQAISSLKKE